jgi:hypothetical protein
MRSAELDSHVVTFLSECGARIAGEFGRDLIGEATPRVGWGERPEFRWRTADADATIIVDRHEPDWWRIRYQIAHEVFHWLCTPPRIFHWTHELFAVETAVRAMEELGEQDYVKRATAELRDAAEALALDHMLTTQLSTPYPHGLYGRAWLAGGELTAAIGWDRLKPLAHSFDESGAPSLQGWIRSLDHSEQKAVEEVLGPPSADWV